MQSTDLIKREDAIDAIECVDWYHQNRNKDMVSGANSAEHQAWYKADDVYKALEAVPKADTPQGEWSIDSVDEIELSYGGTAYEPVYKCSHCGRVTESYVRFDKPLMPEDADFPNFCGWCGAKMKGADDE